MTTHLLPNLPLTPQDLERVAQSCRSEVKSKSLLAAGGNIIPLPGMDIAIDMTLMVSMIHSINHKFGLSDAQIGELDSSSRVFLGNFIAQTGAQFAGRMVTKLLLQSVVQKQIAKVAGKQALKFIPIVGQVVSGSISYATLRYIGMKHIKECREVVARARGWSGGQNGECVDAEVLD